MPSHVDHVVSTKSGMTKENMNSPQMNAPGSDLSPKLRTLEKQLNDVIEEIQSAGFQVTDSKQSVTASQVSMLSASDVDLNEVSLVSLRFRMRLLRRWRNGSVQCSGNDLDELSSYVDHSRLIVLEKQIAMIKQQLEDLEGLMFEEGLVNDDPAKTRRFQLDLQAGSLSDAVEELRSGDELVGEAVLSNAERQSKELMSEIKYLRGRLYSKSGREHPVNAPPIRLGESFQRRRSKGTRRGKVKPTKIEEHPHVNRILRNIGRVHRMLHVLRRDGHVSTETDDNLCACAENDVDVLDRQLQRLHRWEQLDEICASDDIKQLEHVVSAIERHIRSDIDLDSPIKSSTLSRSTSSNHNGQNGDLNNHNGHNNDDTLAEDGIINERLV